ncbi:MAG: NupC/NupG family nucleoside CNT transporter [Pseudomonadales bacterium]|nr:NupC/NupG family nucleoside CNT transporter [Pseudomonadales bacterium]
MGLLGIVVLFTIAILLSDNRKAINLRTVIGAFILQASIAAVVLYIPVGKTLLAAISNGIQHIINYANVGSQFLFGNLLNGSQGFIFAINVLPIIIFISALVAVLYYLGIMQLIVGSIGGLISRALGTSQVESLSATANIFVGQTEAPLMVRPYINKMTQSELFAVMVGGLASVAGAVMVGYASMGVELKFLIAASFMAAPGGLLMAKIIKPETEKPASNNQKITFDQDQVPANIIDAAATGALTGMQLALNIGAILIAFIALIALFNGALSAAGSLLGIEGLSLQSILGYVFAPLAYLLGVPWHEAVAAGGLIGQKIVLNEFVAYIGFIDIKANLSQQSQIIITFALCGFANFASIAILLGGIGGMAPNRRPDIARMGLRAVAAGTLSNLMSATLAGLFFTLQGY